MDADDISALDRLEKQLDVMEKSQDLAACGTLGLILDADGKIIRNKEKINF